MSLRVGLGASQADIDVQGEIDFDFFDESNSSSQAASKSLCDEASQSADSCEPARGVMKSSHPSESTSQDFNKPVITISCDNTTGAIQKSIKTIIPTPFNYKDNKCGKRSPSTPIRKVALSPRLKSKIFKDENEISDDSSISSMSESESDMSSVSSDSFELNDDASDSMTDVSPLQSPFKCSTPNAYKKVNDCIKISPKKRCKEAKKENVKFNDEVENKDCSKCETIDIQELVRAMNNLKMKQTSRSSYSRKCKSPILTHNAKCRKNLSFTNEEVRKIDNDNQILLNKIIAQQKRVSSPVSNTSRIISPAAVNRQKHQRQIDLENLALLKRLEATKASRDLNRLHLLNDYDHRSSGVLSRASSRLSYPCSSSQSFSRLSNHSSGRSSAVSVKSSHSSVLRSQSLSAMNRP